MFIVLKIKAKMMKKKMIMIHELRVEMKALIPMKMKSFLTINQMDIILCILG